MGLPNNLGKLSNMITSTGSAVGIAQTSPSFTLDVTGTGRFTGALTGTSATFSGDLTLNNGSADGGQLVLASSGFSDWNLDNFSGRFRAYYGSTERFTITAAGNMGLGTNSPALTSANRTTLDIGNATESILVLSTGGSWRSYFYNDGTNLSIANSGGFINFDVLGERMRITNTGNVGIGSSSITNGTAFGGGGQVNRLKVASGNYTCLEINGNTSGGSIQFTYGTNLPNQVGGLIGYNYASGGDMGMYISNLTNGLIAFATNNTERMRIRNDGFLKVKGNAANYISPNNNSHEISTNQASNYNTFLVSQTASDPYGLYIWYSGASPNNNMNEFLACADSTNAKAYIFANGNLANRNGSYGTISSDIRLKENIANATSKLNDILKLNVVNFNFKDDIDKKKQIGFIAQEFQDVFPSLVSIRDTRKYDEEGNLISGLEDALGVNVGMEFAILVKAIQELNAKVTALENR